VWTGPELAARLGVTTRSIRRDVERLRGLGYPVLATQGLGGGYQLGRGKDLPPLLLILTTELQSEHVTTRVAALNWINMLHEKDAVEMNKSIAELLPALLKAISDVADEVVLITLQVTCLSCGVCVARLPFVCLTPPPHYARAPFCVCFF
jgi:predicted DNA-binding transcriptional regulator YafY